MDLKRTKTRHYQQQPSYLRGANGRQTAISRSSLADGIADDLRERILSGELAEGEAIRQEALAEEYDVSHLPIREALKRLDTEGLVLVATNRGASVTKNSLREPAKFEHRDLLTLAEARCVDDACAALTQHISRTKEELLTLDAENRARADDTTGWTNQTPIANSTYRIGQVHRCQSCRASITYVFSQELTRTPKNARLPQRTRL
ncbi:GntR family transcriptional regulator [Phaeobacter porticola]|uniref:Transcriptional regulator, GntR family n=1 Tax=Phaeobacter porticola TaxID=1844006 RepID=A0A1L3IA27_9RHOB|nr:GntR family transcriptional regulator [Phaeobacter porticola]APG48938.1 transcriptional regulator, GntR family [Phaeobacter porticola]